MRNGVTVSWLQEVSEIPLAAELSFVSVASSCDQILQEMVQEVLILPVPEI
jgi:hypothetical protein